MMVVLSTCCSFFFFFKQKTAYEIGTGDWSSDVCSSDLTISIPSRSKFCFYEDVQIANKGLEGAEHAKFSFTVIRGGKYKDVAASVISMHDKRFGSM